LTKSGNTKAEWEASGLLQIIRDLGMRTGADFNLVDVNHVDLGNKYNISALTAMANFQYGDISNVDGTNLKIS